MYPYLNDNEILEITNDYQEYKNLVQATETFTDFLSFMKILILVNS